MALSWNLWLIVLLLKVFCNAETADGRVSNSWAGGGRVGDGKAGMTAEDIGAISP